MSRHRRARAPLKAKAISLAVAACFSAAVPTAAFANGTGAVVVSGQASFNTSGNTLTITNTAGAIINWQSLSNVSGELMKFIQPSAASWVMNKVVGGDPSTILGAVWSNGRVFLINPNGIMFGADAQINVAGLVASTLNLSNSDFLAGRLKFTDTPGAGSVVNKGGITTPSGGQVYLIAPNVQNTGIITNPQGEIILAAGRSVELVDAGTPSLRVEISAPDTEAVNVGQIIANSGRIGIYAGLIKNSGTIQADGVVVGADGKILLKATRDVALESGSLISASGGSGVGDGGEVRIVADNKLDFKQGAAVRVDGGVRGGNGGLLELSGHQGMTLDGEYSGMAQVTGYQGGRLILDPNNVDITTNASCGSDLCLNPSAFTNFTFYQVQANNNILVSAPVNNPDLLLWLQADIDNDLTGAIIQNSPAAVLSVGTLWADAGSGIGAAGNPLLSNANYIAFRNFGAGAIHGRNTGDPYSLQLSTNNSPVNIVWNGGAKSLNFSGGTLSINSPSGLTNNVDFTNYGGSIGVGTVNIESGVSYDRLYLRAEGGGISGNSPISLDRLELQATSGAISLTNVVSDLTDLQVSTDDRNATISWGGGTKSMVYTASTGELNIASANGATSVKYENYGNNDIRPHAVDVGNNTLALFTQGAVTDFDGGEGSSIRAGGLSVRSGVQSGTAISLQNVRTDLYQLHVDTAGGDAAVLWNLDDFGNQKSLVFSGGELDIGSSGYTDVGFWNRGTSILVNTVDIGDRRLVLGAAGDISDGGEGSVKAGALSVSSGGVISLTNVTSDLSELSVVTNDQAASVIWNTDTTSKSLTFAGGTLDIDSSPGGTDVTFLSVFAPISGNLDLSGAITIGSVNVGSANAVTIGGGTLTGGTPIQASLVRLFSQSGMDVVVQAERISAYNLGSGDMNIQADGAEGQTSVETYGNTGFIGSNTFFPYVFTNDSGAFYYSGQNGSNGIENQNGSITLTTSLPTLNINAGIFAANEVTLIAPQDGTITQSVSAPVIANGLAMDAGTITMLAANQVNILAGTARRGSFVFNNATDLAIGSVGDYSGVVSTGDADGAAAEIGITVTGGSLTVNQLVEATGADGDEGGAASIELITTKGITVDGAEGGGVSANGGYGAISGVGGAATIKLTTSSAPIELLDGGYVSAYGGGSGTTAGGSGNGGDAKVTLESSRAITVDSGTVRADGGEGDNGGKAIIKLTGNSSVPGTHAIDIQNGSQVVGNGGEAFGGNGGNATLALTASTGSVSIAASLVQAQGGDGANGGDAMVSVEAPGNISVSEGFVGASVLAYGGFGNNSGGTASIKLESSAGQVLVSDDEVIAHGGSASGGAGGSATVTLSGASVQLENGTVGTFGGDGAEGGSGSATTVLDAGGGGITINGDGGGNSGAVFAEGATGAVFLGTTGSVAVNGLISSVSDSGGGIIVIGNNGVVVTRDIQANSGNVNLSGAFGGVRIDGATVSGSNILLSGAVVNVESGNSAGADSIVSADNDLTVSAGALQVKGSDFGSFSGRLNAGGNMNVMAGNVIVQGGTAANAPAEISWSNGGSFDGGDPPWDPFSTGPWNITTSGNIVVSAGGAGSYAQIKGGPDVNLLLTGSASEIQLNSGSTSADYARIWALSPETIRVFYLGRSEGGYVVNGSEAAFDMALPSDFFGGFFAGGSPIEAELGTNLIVAYGVAGLPAEVRKEQNFIIGEIDRSIDFYLNHAVQFAEFKKDEDKDLPMCK